MQEPTALKAYITEYRRRILKASDDNQGVVYKFIGDAAMILLKGRQAAVNALGRARFLGQEMTTWSEERLAEGKAPVAVGIGLHWGEVFSGVVGSSERLEYTVFGDTVNIAARLEQLTKTEAGAIIASETLLQRAGIAPARNGWDALPATELRGRRGCIAIFGRGLV